MSIVQWNEDAIVARALEAARGGIDETTGAAVPVARGEANVDTGYMRDHIDHRPATIQGDTVTGSFGVYDDDPEYAAAQEYQLPPRGKAFIRPAADREFPQLAERVAKRFR
jgi:hypothetical protein